MNENKPNILFIMADQLVPMLMGAYGHPVVKTPNIDKLVARGVRFDAAYSPHPVCAPARAAMMAGRYASRIGAYDNSALFRADEPTIAHYLTNAGYDCVLSGKMHFVGPDQLHGFRSRFLPNIYPSDFRWIHKTKADQARQYVGEAIHVNRWSRELSYDEEAHACALNYLRTRSLCKEKKPFFLCVSYHHPHEAFWPPKKYWDMYEDCEIDVPQIPDNIEETYSELDKWIREYNNVHGHIEKILDPESNKRVRRAYYALITYIDDKVGELLATLEDQGFDKNTVIVFTSDHGDMLCERAMVQKRVFYEWSARVPLILTFPDGWQSGVVRDEPTNLIDLMPTLLDIAQVPMEDRFTMDGRSLITLLDGSDKQERESISENPADSNVKSPCFMIRKGDYKYTYIHNYPAQLFNIKNDPDEWNNLSGDPEYAQIEEELKNRILTLFDPDTIHRDVIDATKKRILIDRAMVANKTLWSAAVQPPFEPVKH